MWLTKELLSREKEIHKVLLLWCMSDTVIKFKQSYCIQKSVGVRTSQSVVLGVSYTGKENC